MSEPVRDPAPVTVIGGGLAGAEAACLLGRHGAAVTLIEMRPHKLTPAHRTGALAELVCSNSLKSLAADSASGLLKAEMEALGSVTMRAARATAVPAGSALAVDREAFSAFVTREVVSWPSVRLRREEAQSIPPEGMVIVATGPLTSEALAAEIAALAGSDALFFYDAIAPIVVADSINLGVAFRASRYGKGGDDYINCPLSAEEYERFLDELLAARRTPPREFEEPVYYEGCLPIETMAERGRETLSHGPMKPVGLTDPRTGRRPHAVVQLRQDDAAGSLFNMVGFQTRLAWPEQERVFRLIPGLERAEFARLGSMHRNTFIRSPGLLAPDLSLRARPGLFFAGQITGVEGYLESAAMGILAGLNALMRLRHRRTLVPPPETVMGALVAYITNPDHTDFQPMNANFGILPPPPDPVKKSLKKPAQIARAEAGRREFAAAAERALAESLVPR
jgi:methylenetetrahydrofolate--tRNA-(uracil-5-)-methyltransferase